jgi:hypothetical protein
MLSNGLCRPKVLLNFRKSTKHGPDLNLIQTTLRSSLKYIDLGMDQDVVVQVV